MRGDAKRLVWRKASEDDRRRFNQSILEDIDARSNQLDQKSTAEQAGRVSSGTSRGNLEDSVTGDY